MSDVSERLRMGTFSSGAYRPLTSPDLLDVRVAKCLKRMAGTTGLEPAASAVTGQRSNQLNYVPTRQINDMRNRQCLCSLAQIENSARILYLSLACVKRTGSCRNAGHV
jgi:hypothetical protein